MHMEVGVTTIEVEDYHYAYKQGTHAYNASRMDSRKGLYQWA